MEKMIWEKPQMNEVAFAANEYVAACGDGGTNYIFTCDANSNSWVSDGGYVYIESGKEEGFQAFGENADTFRSNYNPCSEEHTTENKGEFFDGWLTNLIFGNAKKVIVWTGLDGNNTHCTTNLDMDSWETAKS